MENYRGKAASPGIAVGRIIELKKKERTAAKVHIKDTEHEMHRFEDARQRVSIELKELYEKALKEAGEGSAALFEVHRMIIEDEAYVNFIADMIQTQQVNAEYAVLAAGEYFAGKFAVMDNVYMRERARDIQDISENLIHAFSGFGLKGWSKDVLQHPCIILADDLTPSETLQLDREKVLAFIIRNGSMYSHTAILARNMGIPAIVDIPIPADAAQQIGIVDGTSAEVWLSPDPFTMQKFLREQEKQKEQKQLLSDGKGKEIINKPGQKIRLYANIGSAEELDRVLEYHAEGIGLFRSEFLYLQSESCPTEEEQFKVYRSIAERMEGKKVIVRTLDIGADKQVNYLHLNQERNPALGCRAIRLCLEKKDMFRTQLRALYRACAFGNIAIMIPMITSVWEVEKVKEIIEDVKTDLKEKRILHGEAELGIMIETPAAVMISDLLAKEVDFFSIGTNDLTQYTLAADRENPNVDLYYDTNHPAILRMIQMVVGHAHENGIRVGICGESAADTLLTQTYLAMGIDELSVSPCHILPVWKRICEL